MVRDHRERIPGVGRIAAVSASRPHAPAENLPTRQIRLPATCERPWISCAQPEKSCAIAIQNCPTAIPDWGMPIQGSGNAIQISTTALLQDGISHPRSDADRHHGRPDTPNECG